MHRPFYFSDYSETIFLEDSVSRLYTHDSLVVAADLDLGDLVSGREFQCDFLIRSRRRVVPSVVDRDSSCVALSDIVDDFNFNLSPTFAFSLAFATFSGFSFTLSRICPTSAGLGRTSFFQVVPEALLFNSDEAKRRQRDDLFVVDLGRKAKELVLFELSHSKEHGACIPRAFRRPKLYQLVVA